MPSNLFLRDVLPSQRPQRRVQDVNMDEGEEIMIGAFPLTSLSILPPIGYAPALVPTLSHPLQEEWVDQIPRPMLVDAGVRSSSATTEKQVDPVLRPMLVDNGITSSSTTSSGQLISTQVQKKNTVKNRPTKPRKRSRFIQGRELKFKGTEDDLIWEGSIAEKTHVVEQQALTTRQIIDQKGAELEAQAKKAHLIEHKALATKKLLKQREGQIVELETQVNVYATELSKLMAQLDKLEGDVAKKKHNVNDSSASQVAVLSASNSSNNPSPSEEDVHMASATRERVTETKADSSSAAKSQIVVWAPNSSNNPLPSEEDIHMASAIKERATETKANSNSVAKDAEEQNQEITESRRDDLERVDSEGGDSEGEDFNMSGGDKRTGKGKEVKGRKHHRATSNNGGNNSTTESSGDSDGKADDDVDESNDKKSSVPKPILHFQRSRGGIPTSLIPSLGMTPEQVAAIVQIMLATQSQNKSVALQQTKKKSVTGTIVKQAHREKDPRTRVLVSAIREHMNKLLHLKSATEAHKLPQLTKVIVDAFAKGEGTGPKLVPMEFAFAHKKKKLWNGRIAEMFFNDFLDKEGRNLGVQKSEWPTIYEKFWQCFLNLRKEWKNWQAKEGEDDKEVEFRNSKRKKKALKTSRRDARRHHLQELRIQIADRNKIKPDGSVDDVWYFLWVVATRLGLGGASSDESTIESGNNRQKYFIKSVPWRSQDLIPYLQIIDHDFNQFNCYGNAKAGNPYQERTCLAVGTPSTRSAIKGLPLNFYDKTWLLNLTNKERSFLQPGPGIEFPAIIAYNE